MRDIVGEEKRSDEGEVFYDFMKSLNEEVNLRLNKSNQKYMENVDNSRRHHIF